MVIGRRGCEHSYMFGMEVAVAPASRWPTDSPISILGLGCGISNY